MTSSPFYVHGIALVNTGGELCDACGKRKAIGASVSGHLLCPRCAGLHSQLADELAAEVEASRIRRLGETNGYRRQMLLATARAQAETARRRGKVSLPMRKAAEIANLESQSRARASREEMVIGALAQAGVPCTARQLADLTGMSLASVKRTVAELLDERRITGKRAQNSLAFTYALRVRA